MEKSEAYRAASILIVEDDLLVQMELADWLTDYGLVVLTASSADEAIAILDSHPQIDVLVTDIQMPGSMDGIRLAHHVAARWPPVRIVVISGNWRTELADLPLHSVFVPKPFRPRDLWRALSPLSARHVQ
jgi:CheY-like chemotaxis protein